MAGDAETVTIEQLQAQMKTLQDAQAERDRKINDLTAEKTTLEQRIASTTIQPAAGNAGDPNLSDEAVNREAEQILQEATTDLAGASKKLGSLIKKVATSTANIAMQGVESRIQPTIENEKFAEKVRQENADLMGISDQMENIVAAEANAIVRALPRQQQTFQEFQKAVKKVVADKREKLKDLLKKPEEKKPDVPAGAKAEDGGGVPAGGAAGGGIQKKNESDDKTTPNARLATASQKGLF